MPLAFRAGAKGKRAHIFWQKRIREGDVSTPFWYPCKTDGGMMREDRIVLPIPPGVHWRDEMAILLPTAGVLPSRGETCLALPEGDTSVARTNAPVPRLRRADDQAMCDSGRLLKLRTRNGSRRPQVCRPQVRSRSGLRRRRSKSIRFISPRPASCAIGILNSSIPESSRTAVLRTAVLRTAIASCPVGSTTSAECCQANCRANRGTNRILAQPAGTTSRVGRGGTMRYM